MLVKKLLCYTLAYCLSLPLFSACTSSDTAAQSSSNVTSPPKILDGKTISILGDSNATFHGVSNSTEYNCTLGGNYSYFPRHDIEDNAQTWWSLVEQYTGAEIFVNNSSSGAKASGDRFDNGWSERCVQLHCDRGPREGEEPDVILVKLGENDFYGGVPCGHFDTLSDVWTEADGYITPETYAQALAIILHKISLRYQNADIFVFTLTYRIDCNRTQLELYNDCIRSTAEYFTAKVIEWYGFSNFHPTTHTSEGIHYNQAGMRLIADCVTQTL